MRTTMLAVLMIAGSAFAAGPKHAQKQAPQQTEEQRAADESAKKMQAAQTIVQDGLNDPESARFRKVALSPKGRAVCGEVNAKNKMGGYVGFRRFIVASDQTGVEEDGSSFVESNWHSRCIDDVLYSEVEAAK